MIKYFKDGTMFRVLEEYKNTYTGTRFLYFDNGYDDATEEYFDEYPICVNKKDLYDSAPVPMIDKQVASKLEHIESLNKKIEKLNSSLREVSKKVYRKNAEFCSMQQDFEKNDALKRVLDFVNGGITHIVTIGWSGKPIIHTRAEYFKHDDYGRDVKLLTLYGKSNGDITWKLNQYSDGSGCDYEVYCFKSEDDARKFCQEYFDGLKPEKARIDIVRFALENGYTVSEEYKSDAVSHELKKLNNEISNLISKEMDVHVKIESFKKEFGVEG